MFSTKNLPSHFKCAVRYNVGFFWLIWISKRDTESPSAQRIPVLNAGYGGMSGKAVKPIGIGCIYTIYETLKENGYNIPLIGIGGIETAEDIIEYTEAGASAVAIGTAFVNLRLDQIKNYLSELVINLGIFLESLEVENLNELVGAAHA